MCGGGGLVCPLRTRPCLKGRYEGVLGEGGRLSRARRAGRRASTYQAGRTEGVGQTVDRGVRPQPKGEKHGRGG